MTVLTRWRVQWTGFTGAPGVSTWYHDNSMPTDPVAPLAAFFTAIKSLFSSRVTWSFPTAGDDLDDATGTLTGAATALPQASISGVDGGNYSAPSGVMVQWRTATIVHGHRLMGRTFLVPCAASATQSDGTMDDTKRGTLQAAANTLMAAYAGSLRVWNRPIYKRQPDGSRLLVRSGSSAPIVGTYVPDRISVLRSRRD